MPAPRTIGTPLPAVNSQAFGRDPKKLSASVAVQRISSYRGSEKLETRIGSSNSETWLL